MPAADLQERASAFGLSGSVYADVPTALEAARAAADPLEDLIFVGGSTFVVADVL
jgi:hypothetical protein